MSAGPRAVLRSAAALLLLLTVAATAVPVQEADVRALSERIAKEKDGVDPAVFEELAAIGDERSYRALAKALDALKTDEARGAACLALRHYAGSGELESDAISLLRKEAGRGKTVGRKRGAVRALAHFGDPAVEVLEAILERNKDPGCKAIACDALVPLFGQREDPEALGAIVAHASLSKAPGVYVGIPPARAKALAELGHARVVRQVLAEADGPAARAVLFAKLQDRDAPRAWKLMLIELLGPREGVDVSQALAGTLGDSDPTVALVALETLVRRDDWDGYEDELRPLLRAKDRGVRRAAVIALGRLVFTRDDWHGEALELAGDRDDAVRMGAIACLAELRTDEAVARLHEMLADREWAVRAEVLQRVGEMRRVESVPVLIRRLEQERGRLRWDVYAVLRTLTGLDLGHLATRWKTWWENEGQGFVLPTLAEAVEAERTRIERGQVDRTVATSFYGLQVVSERVCYVLDVSGSMRLPPGVFDMNADVPPGTKTRMDIAKEQLSAALRSMPDGQYFNLIFFETEVRELSHRMLRMSKPSRQKALRFVKEQYSLGSTALYPALKLAFADRLVDTIYILTDGAPTAGEITDIEEIRAEVRRWNAARHVRIHGVAMGLDSDLLRWLAEDTGGRYVRID